MRKPLLSQYFDARRPLANGKFPVRLQLIFKVDGKSIQKYYSTGISLSRDEWERIWEIKVRGDLKEAKRKILAFEARASKIIEDNHFLTPDSFDAIFTGKKVTTDDFITFALAELETMKGILRDKTWTGYENRLENLKKYKSVIPISSIDYSFLVALKKELVGIQKRKLNGVYQDFACIKKFYRIAVVRGMAHGNPFENFKLGKEETVKAWLTKDELQLLMDLLNTEKITDAVKNTLRHFLFSCFTGLRFGDKITFSENEIIDGRIQLKTSKRGKYVTIPFNDQAKQLLPQVLGRKLKQSNSRVNEDIQTCMNEVKIKKHIKFHSSRHTFAINCLLLGIDLITIRDWLGHKSVTTTEIYVKIAAQYKDESMKKFDSFFETKKPL